jgi:nitroreductase
MELETAMRTAAAVRRFTVDPVSDEVIYRILDSARFAPSGTNRQGWHVIVVRDPKLRAELKNLYLRSWRPLYAAQLAAVHGDPDVPGQLRPGTVEGWNHYAEHLDELPVHLVVLIDRSALLTPWPAINESTFASGSSLYPFVQNLVLAIRGEGLGTSLTMILNNHEAEVRRLLDIPDGFSLAAHLGIGRPARPHPTRLHRRPVEEFTSVDRFGGPALRPPA